MVTPFIPGVQLFTVNEDGTLELDSLSLVGGWGFGAAVFLNEGSRLVARDCSFVGHGTAGERFLV